MEKLGKNIASRVRSLLTPTAEALGYAIWDVEYVKEGAEMVLRITIDKPEGITIDDCEAMHRAIDPILDEADPIENAYRLEVSSPGLERELSRPEHFASAIGEMIEVRLFAPLDGRRTVTGTLVAADDDSVTVAENGQNTVLPKSAVAKVKTMFDWTNM